MSEALAAIITTTMLVWPSLLLLVAIALAVAFIDQLWQR
jgi:hypothetical protein